MAVSEAALDVVSSARLSPIEHQLLRHFVQDAFDSELASKYLLSRLNSHLDAESSLRNFKHDWRKLVARRKQDADAIPSLTLSSGLA